MTRSVRDTAAVLALTQGWRPGDSIPLTAPGPVPQQFERTTQSLRIGVALNPFNGQVETDPECVAAAEQTARELERMGHAVEIVTPPTHSLGTEEWHYGPPIGPHFTQVAHLLDRVAETVGRPITEADVGPQLWAAAELGRGATFISLLEFSEAVQRHTVAFDTWWAAAGIDVLLTPTVPLLPPPITDYLPPPHGTFEFLPDNPLAGVAVNGDLIGFTQIFNWTGQPAISLPLAMSASGLPIGIQLVAGRMRDDVLLRLSYDLEQAMPWADRRPKVCASTGVSSGAEGQ